MTWVAYLATFGVLAVLVAWIMLCWWLLNWADHVKTPLGAFFAYVAFWAVLLAGISVPVAALVAAE